MEPSGHPEVASGSSSPNGIDPSTHHDDTYSAEADGKSPPSHSGNAKPIQQHDSDHEIHWDDQAETAVPFEYVNRDNKIPVTSDASTPGNVASVTSPNRRVKRLDNSRSSQYRRETSFRRLKRAVEALPPEILEGLSDQVTPSPSSRHGLVQAEVFGYAAVIVERYSKS